MGDWRCFPVAISCDEGVERGAAPWTRRGVSMPVIRIVGPGENQGDNQGEGIDGPAGMQAVKQGVQAVPQIDAEYSRITTNMAIADQIGRFVAGEINNRFKEENLADRMKGGERMIMGSVSWG